MPFPIVIICIDGLDPEYLDSFDMPNLSRMAISGFMTVGKGVMPSVTNVNNVSLLTASYPEVHGICSNYMLDPNADKGVYMESAGHILAQTIFENADSKGKVSMMVTAKDKLRNLLSAGTEVAISAEKPSEQIVRAIGPPPDIYSLEVNGWVIDAGNYLMGTRDDIDLIYLTTTDYAMHKYAPGDPQSDTHLTILDDALGRLIESNPEATVLLTADHGMSTKRFMIDTKGILSRYGVESNLVPIIKDRYLVHHSNLGGAAFINLSLRDVNKAIEILQNAEEIDKVMTQDEACNILHLRRERIGDILVTGAKDVVFGDTNQVSLPNNLRSHGSYYELDIPIIGYNGNFDEFVFQNNYDVGRYVFERVLDC